MLLALAVLGCAGDAPAPPSHAAAAAASEAGVPSGTPTAAGRYRLSWSAEPDPVPFNALFSVRVVLTDPAGAPVPEGSVTVDASMPQHGHGMPTHPVADPPSCPEGVLGPAGCSHPGGVYRSQGMKFHMQGEWVIHFQVDGPRGPDSLDVHYAL